MKNYKDFVPGAPFCFGWYSTTAVVFLASVKDNSKIGNIRRSIVTVRQLTQNERLILQIFLAFELPVSPLNK